MNNKIKSIEVYSDYWLVNDRYAIYKDGIVYDTVKALDIPLYIFKYRDELIKHNCI